MTPFKHFSKNQTLTRRVRQGGLYVAVAAMLAAHSQCSNSGNGSDWEEVTTYEITKGVITTLEEVEPDRFEIVDEQLVEGKDSSKVIIKRLSGTIDTLSLAQAQGLVGQQDTVYKETTRHPSGGYHGHGLGSVLWWGTMGYMMGRSFSSPTQTGFYRPTAAPAAQSLSSQVRSTAIPRTEMRPVNGRSGYFKNSGRSSGTA